MVGLESFNGGGSLFKITVKSNARKGLFEQRQQEAK